MAAAETPPLVPMGALSLNEPFSVENDAGEQEEEDPGLAVAKTLEGLGAKVFYEKPLTSSDANGSGRVVIPKVGRSMMETQLEWIGLVAKQR